MGSGDKWEGKGCSLIPIMRKPQPSDYCTLGKKYVFVGSPMRNKIIGEIAVHRCHVPATI